MVSLLYCFAMHRKTIQQCSNTTIKYLNTKYLHYGFIKIK